MAYENGKTYYIIPTCATGDAAYNQKILNKEVSPLALNTAGVSDYHYNNRNVNVYSLDWSADMQWKVMVYDGFARILCASNTAFGLDYYYGNNNAGNCDIYQVSGNDEDSKINFRTINASENLYRIQCYRNNADNNLYLTATGTSNGADVRWEELDSSKAAYQTWWLVPVENIAENTPPSTPSTIYTGILARHKTPQISNDKFSYYIDGIPDHDPSFASNNYIEDDCQMHPACGLNDGIYFNTSPDGIKIKDTLQKYIKLVFGNSSLTMLDKDTCYYLFGERRVNNDTSEFHPGVDIYYNKANAAIHSLFDGEVVYPPQKDYNENYYGAVGIYNDTLKVTFNYLHMKDISVKAGDIVSAGDPIGIQSNVSTENISDHLHFEVMPGKYTSGWASPVKSPASNLTSIIPYGYMDGVMI